MSPLALMKIVGTRNMRNHPNHHEKDVIERMKIAIGSENGQGENALQQLKIKKITVILETRNVKILLQDQAAIRLPKLSRVQLRLQSHQLQRNQKWIIIQWRGKLEIGRDCSRSYKGARRWKEKAHLVREGIVKVIVGVWRQLEGSVTSTKMKRSMKQEPVGLKARGRREDGDRPFSRSTLYRKTKKNIMENGFVPDDCKVDTPDK